MFGSKMIFSGFVSGIMLVASSFATPASAGQVSFNLDIGIESLMDELFGFDQSSRKVKNVGHRGVSLRKIRRKLRRRGLYPVSDYRLRGDVVVLRAEDDYGTLFRIVADSGNGKIIRIRRVGGTKVYRSVPVYPSIFNDGYHVFRPGFDRPIRRNKPHYNNTHAKREAANAAKARAHAKRKAAKAAKARTHAKRKAANAAKARVHAKRKAAKPTKARVVRKPNKVKARELSPAQRKVRKIALVSPRGKREEAKLSAAKKRKSAHLTTAREHNAAKLKADRNRRAGVQSTSARKRP